MLNQKKEKVKHKWVNNNNNNNNDIDNSQNGIKRKGKRKIE